MQFTELNRWDVSPEEAILIQCKLRERVSLVDGFDEINYIAGADVSITRDGDISHAVVAVFTFPNLDFVEKQSATLPVTFPYVPGLLSFREAPCLLEAFRQIQTIPDMVLVDGQGLAHPRRFGLACHMGVTINRPTIGCGMTRLVGRYAEPADEFGATTPLLSGDNEIIGNVVRTRKHVKPIFVSPGTMVSFNSCVRIVLECCLGYRLPEPIRRVHNMALTEGREILEV